MIRSMEERDLQRVSALIQNTLLVSNLSDYDLEVIGNLLQAFAPERLRALAGKRSIYLYEQEDAVVGVIGLEGGRVYNFFVAPDRQGSGIGARLLEFVEQQARSRGRRLLAVDSSLTAVSFYSSRGYRRTGTRSDDSFGPTVTMEKSL